MVRHKEKNRITAYTQLLSHTYKQLHATAIHM